MTETGIETERGSATETGNGNGRLPETGIGTGIETGTETIGIATTIDIETTDVGTTIDGLDDALAPGIAASVTGNLAHHDPLRKKPPLHHRL